MNETRPIEINQTIHGYRDGHELLSTSLKLDPAARRTMLAISDLSGDGSPRGFETYLTGYPIDEACSYAFARTWYAHEMKRPGCVWTHTLLVRFEDMSRIADVASLQALLRRPAPGQVPPHLERLEYVPDSHNQESLCVDGAFCEIMVRLHEQDRPVVVFCSRADEYEDVVVQTWLKQWDRLKPSFMFCTGSLEPRSIAGRSFDLQVIPESRRRRVMRRGDEFSVVTKEDVVRTGQASRNSVGRDWRDIMIRNLVEERPSLQKFIYRFAVDVVPNRSAYRNLISCWALLESSGHGSGSRLQDVVSTVAGGFSGPDDAASLKRAILGRQSIVRAAGERECIHEILSTHYLASLDLQDLELASRARRIFFATTERRATELAWLLQAPNLNSAGEEWVSIVTDEISLKDLHGLFLEDRELATEVLYQRPELLLDVELWTQPREFQLAALDMLSLTSRTSLLPKAISALVSANAAALVQPLVQKLGRQVIRMILDGLDQARAQEASVDEWQWSSCLSVYESELVEWLAVCEQPQPWTLGFVVGMLGVSCEAVRSGGGASLARHLGSTSSDSTFVVEYAAFCLAVGLQNFDLDAGPLAVRAFVQVHAAAMHSSVSERSWQWLGPFLPRPGWLSFESWDDGERLRRALVDSFIRYQWEPLLLREAAADANVSSWIRRYGASSVAGHELMLRAFGE